MKKHFSTKTVSLLFASLFACTLAIQIYTHQASIQKAHQSITNYRKSSHSITPQPTPTSAPVKISNISKEAPIQTEPQEPNEPSIPWGKAEKVDNVTYTIRVGYDSSMTTPQELLDALNQYRTVHSRGNLAWNDTLASYSQSRAQSFQDNKGTDKHAGFNSFLENEDGFSKLGFDHVGENSYYGGPLTGTHLIEWVFSQSPGHNANQLNEKWTHVGIGVTANGVNLIFGSH